MMKHFLPFPDIVAMKKHFMRSILILYLMKPILKWFSDVTISTVQFPTIVGTHRSDQR